jgi:hypothetical protein
LTLAAKAALVNVSQEFSVRWIDQGNMICGLPGAELKRIDE